MKVTSQFFSRLARTARFAGVIRFAREDKRGQVLPWVAMMMMLFLGMGAFVLDAGHAYFCYRQLQAATDAAALAGAKQVYTSQAAATAAAYAAVVGGQNTYSSLNNVTMASGWPKLECLTTVVSMGVLCEGPSTANAIQVKETATVPTFFAQIFGISKMNLSATATATPGKPVPLNVALVIDTTLSMNTYDSNCGATQMQCAMTGAQTLLASLAPSIDSVSVFTFPSISTSSVANDASCANGGAVGVPYSFPTLPSSSSTGYVVASGDGTYQVTGFSNNYRSSNTSTTANSSSSLVQILGAPASNGQSAIAGCLNPPSDAGNYGTDLAGTIYAAQAALGGELAGQIATQTAGSPTPLNVMIILSDGNPNASTRYGLSNQFFQTTPSASGIYPSDVGNCGQAVVAGQTARSNGTLIFSIAYGAMATGSFSWNSNDPSDSINNAGCPTDQNSFFSAFHLGGNVSSYPNISPCQTMKDISSPDTATTQFFYSDFNQSGSNSQCYSANSASATGLADIYASIGGTLAKARLIPDGTT